MSINKNFVVKNGFEVSTDLILANADTNKVGIGTTTPKYTLHVNGDIGATDLYTSGIGTFIQELNVGLGGTVLTVLGVGGSVGVGTANPAYLLDVRTVSAGQTALYVKGDVFIDGNLDINFGTVGGDLEVDSAVITNLTPTNINSAGISTFNTLDVNGTIRDINNVSGTSGQYLKSTGTGVEWETFGVYRNQISYISTEGQTD
jgi:hypothetical protein